MCTKIVFHYGCGHTIEEVFIQHQPRCRQLIIDEHTINDINDQLCNLCLPTPPTSDDE